MELYRQAREGFYLLCSLLLEPWIKSIGSPVPFFLDLLSTSRPKLPGDVKVKD